MQECRDEFEIYNCQRTQLSNNKFINGILGVRLIWLDCKFNVFIGSGVVHWFQSFFLLSDSYTSCLYCNIVPVFSCLLDSDNRPGKKEQPSMCLVQGLEKILLSLKM